MKIPDLGHGVLPEMVDKFCYLGNGLDADGRCHLTVTASVKAAQKFYEYLTILTGKRFSLDCGYSWIGLKSSCLH